MWVRIRKYSLILQISKRGKPCKVDWNFIINLLGKCEGKFFSTLTRNIQIQYSGRWNLEIRDNTIKSKKKQDIYQYSQRFKKKKKIIRNWSSKVLIKLAGIWQLIKTRIFHTFPCLPHFNFFINITQCNKYNLKQ